MPSYRLSIRSTLLAIIAILNLIIATQIGFSVYKALANHRNAAILQKSAGNINMLYDAQKFFSLERGASISVLYARPAPSDSLIAELHATRKQADEALQSALGLVKDERNKSESLIAAIEKVKESYLQMQEARHELDAALILSEKNRPSGLADKFFNTATHLIESADALNVTYMGPFLLLNPIVTRQIRFTHLIWGITEDTGREYATLGKAIAQNKFLSHQEEENISNWDGRIQLGWELAQATVANSEWGQKIAGAMAEAQTQYFMNFEQLRDMFIAEPVRGRATPSYPISSQMWLELTAQVVDSLHEMNDGLLKLNQEYMTQIENDAANAIITSLLLFICALGLSYYSWRIITLRVLKPVNSMVNALDKATQGEHVELPTVLAVDEDEISKLANVLRVFQENSRDLEQERDKAQAANIAKTEFLANVSHEIRTPMNVIVGLSNILAKSSPLTQKQNEFVKTLQLSAESLLAVINDMLDFSKIETQAFQLEKIPFSFIELVDEVTTLIAHSAQEKGLALNVDYESACDMEFIGDPTRLRQILTNLLGNAVKFTDQGSITLKIDCRPGQMLGYEDIYIYVSDTGIGIAPEKHNFIFEKFTQADSTITRKYGGTGLGLAIAKTFVEMMDGAIAVESAPGGGAIFTVYVPLPIKGAEGHIENPAQALEAFPETEEGVRVLLVEDYQPNALIAGIYLEQFGFAYDLVKSGQEALEKIKATNYSAVLMDIQMQGMDGYRVSQMIRKYEREIGLPTLKIVGMTDRASAQDREKCMEAGMNDYIAQLFHPEELRHKLAA